MIGLQNLQPQPAMGRTYYLSLPSGLDSQSLVQIIWNLKDLLQNNKKIRILWDTSTDFDFEPIIKNTLETLKNEESPNLNIQDYKTVFYSLKRENLIKHLEEYPSVNWQNYSEFDYQKVSPNSEEMAILENFFLASNGSDFVQLNGKTEVSPNLEMQKEILNQLPIALQSSTNSMFLVQKNPQQYVGAFSLLQVNSQEIQLHYTSGKSTLENVYSGKKMPILMAAMLDLFQNSPIYKNTQILTFSNKDTIVSKLYQSLGFEILATRKCLIVKNNLQAADLQ